MKFQTLALTLGLVLPLTGCDLDIEQESSSSGTDGPSDGTRPPSDDAVGGCRDACDMLQFFDCIDGSTHETCWNACPERTDGDLELFESCVSNSSPTCDPDCLASLLDAPEPGPEPTTTTGSSPSGCEAACQAYVDAGCELEFFEGIGSCAEACAALTPAESAAVAACFNSPQICEVDPACVEEGEDTSAADETGSPTDFECPAACDQLLTFDCIDAQQHADCFDQCEFAPPGDASTFVSCVQSVGAFCDGSCYEVFIG